MASDEQYTSYIDAKIKAHVVKARSFEIVLYNYNQRQFHVKSKRGQTHRLNLHDHKFTYGKTLIYGFPCSHIIVACQFRFLNFRSFVQGYYSNQSYYDTWETLFHPIFDEYEWLPYDGPTIVPSESMKRTSRGRPKSTRLHNEMEVREGKTTITCGLCKQPGHNRRSCQNRSKLIETCMFFVVTLP